MAPPTGFEWSQRKSGDVSIRHHGREVMVVRGDAAAKLSQRLDQASDESAIQHVLARATGNYRRGNERT